jgi:hypothetical protein
MKKLIALLLFAFFGKANAQFYEKSFYFNHSTYSGVNTGIHAGVNSVDRNGNIYHLSGEYQCHACFYRYSFRKINVQTGSTFTFYIPDFTPGSSFPLTDMTGFQDQNLNNYLVWKIDLLPLSLPAYNVAGGFDYALFKYNSSNTLQWIIDIKNGTVFTDMNDNIFIFDNLNFLRKYNSAGIKTDSIQFNASTKPMFADSLGFFYRHNADTLTKFDLNNVIMWQKQIPFTSVDYSMQGEYIFAYNADSIYKVDLNGNYTAYQNFSNAAWGLRFDLNGNYYNKTITFNKYNINDGIKYSLIDTVANLTWMDKTGRFYKFGYLNYLCPNTYSTYDLRIPPSIIKTLGAQTQAYWGEVFNWCQIFNTDETQRDISFTINNSVYPRFCNGNRRNFEFTVSKYPPSLLTSGFDIQLSDSSGNFSNPVNIGHTIGSPASIFFPDTIPTGNNYSIRVIPLDTSFTYSNNILQNLKINQSPTAQMIFAGAVQSSNSLSPGIIKELALCDSTIISSTTNAFPATYKWIQYNGSYFNPISYTQSTQSTVNSTGLYDFQKLVLTVTDSIGCYKSDSIYPTKIYNYNQSSNFPDTVNLVSTPITFKPLLYRTWYDADTAYGNGITPLFNQNYFQFNPLTAGAGWHYVYSKIKPANIIGTLSCMQPQAIDSIFVSDNAFAKITGLSRPRICSGDSVTVFLQFAGDPPFTFSLLQNGTVYGAYTTFGNNYSLVVYPSNAGDFTFQSFSDASGFYTSNAWQNGGYVQVLNYTNPTLTFTGNLSFCAGDSVQLIRNNTYTQFTYSWLKNGVTLPGVTGLSYYAKTQGVYQAGFVSNSNPACTKLSNPVTVAVPCVTPTGGNSTLKTNFNADENAGTLFYQHQNKVILKPNFSSALKAIELYDLNGKKLLLSAVIANDQTITVALPVLSSSVYFITYVFQDRVIKEKILR